jgi:hypothetical protein
MKVGQRVKLKTFNGEKHASERVSKQENYWKLVGEIGIIKQDPRESSIYASFSEEPRVLVKFTKDLNKEGLIAHNNIANSLWILVSDLEIVN